MVETHGRARSEKDITRVSGTLSPSSILGGRTNLILKRNLANFHFAVTNHGHLDKCCCSQDPAYLFWFTFVVFVIPTESHSAI
jgi:hypothetical protein